MLPSLPILDFSYRAERYFKLCRKLFSGQRRNSYFFNNSFGQFSRLIRRAPVIVFSVATFFYHVIRVVFLGAGKKVAWIYTWRIVASMQDKQTRRNWANETFVRKTMSVNNILTPVTHDSVIVGASNPLPLPTALLGLIMDIKIEIAFRRTKTGTTTRSVKRLQTLRTTPFVNTVHLLGVL